MNPTYARTDAELYRFLKRNSYGKAEYDSPVAVKVRFEPYRRKVLSATGEEILSSGKVFCFSELKVNDMLWVLGNSYIIARVDPAMTLSGEVSHWEAIV